MSTKQEILAELSDGLSSGILTQADIEPFITAPQAIAAEAQAVALAPIPAPAAQNKPEKLTAVDVMFYVAGIVLFITIMSIIGQSWENGSPFVHIMLSAGIGIGLWSIAYYLLKSPFQNDIRKGLTNALLLTGSLLVIVGGYIVMNEVVGGYNKIDYMPAAVALVILGGLHIGFDKLIRRDLMLLMGILLAVASFPALLFGFLQDAHAPMDAWASVLIITSGILVYATRVVAKLSPSRENISPAFDSLATFIALMSMYAASYGNYGIFWLGVLIAAVLGIFYLSIILQNKQLLGNGSFFMVLTIISIAFRYFSGFGVTFSLIIATIGVLGSAAVAASINKKYFKQL